MLMGNTIGIHQQAGVISAYAAMPPEDVICRGAVIVVHDIWGVSDHIKSVADRLAAAGYYAVAPELLFMTPEKRKLADEIQQGIRSTDHKVQQEHMAKFRALVASTQTPQFESLTLSRLETCFEYVYNQPIARQRVSMIGFGFGGIYTYALAVRESRLRSAATFYAHMHNYLELELRHIACPIIAFYGGQDAGVQELKKIETHMVHAGVRFTPVVYDHAGPSFFDETNDATYDEKAAIDAWRRLTNFLRIAAF